MPNDTQPENGEAKLDSLCFKYREIANEMQRLTEEKEKIKSELLALMQKKNESTRNFRISRVKQLIISTPIEHAKKLGCVVMREEIDKAALKRLYLQGVQFPGVKEVEWPMVKELFCEKAE